jgi:hypothetical protein
MLVLLSLGSPVRLLEKAYTRAATEPLSLIPLLVYMEHHSKAQGMAPSPSSERAGGVCAGLLRDRADLAAAVDQLAASKSTLAVCKTLDPPVGKLHRGKKKPHSRPIDPDLGYI